MKGHFQGSFDITKYGVKTRVSYESYKKRKDHVFFERMASKLTAHDCYLLMLFNFSCNPECLSYELAGSDAYIFYLKHQGCLERIRTVYNKDLEVIFSLLRDSNKKFKDLLKGKGHPVIIQLLIQEKISSETLLLIDSFLPIIETINKEYKDDLLWSSWYLKLNGYKKLLNINNTLAKDLFVKFKADFI